MLTTLARLRRPRLALGATRAPIMQAALSLCDSAGLPRPRFDPLGRPLHELTEAEAKEAKDAEAKEEGGRRGERGEAEEGIDAPSSARSPRQPWGSFARPDRSDQGGGFGGRGGGGGFGGSGFGRGRGHGSPPADADMMTFQAYVRQRLWEMDEEMFHAKRSTQALAEFALLPSSFLRPTYSLTHLLTYSLTHLLTCSLTHSLTYLLTQLTYRTYLLTYLLTHVLTYLLTYLPTHLLPCYLLPKTNFLRFNLPPKTHDGDKSDLGQDMLQGWR